MNLHELNDGTPNTKTWLNPVIGSLAAVAVNTDALEIGGYAFPAAVGTVGQILHVGAVGDLEFIDLAEESRPFIGIASTTVGNTTVETSLIPVGIGSLTVPSFVVGDSFTLHFNGKMSCLNNSTLTLRLYANAALLISIVMTLIPVATNKGFSNEIHMTLRNAAGDFQTDTEWHSLGNAAKNNQYTDLESVLQNIDISIPNTLSTTFQWAVADVANTITTSTFILSKN